MQGEKDLSKYILPRRIFLAVIFWLLLLSVFFALNTVQPTEFYPLLNCMSTDVTYTDGKTAHFDDGNFGTVHRGDHLVIHIKFPQHYGIKAAELYAPVYNMIVNVSLDGEELYRDEFHLNDLIRHYGNRIYEVLLPDGFENEEMVLEMTATARIVHEDLKKIGIIPANEGWKQIISGQSIVFSVSITLMIMAMVFVFYFLVKSIEKKRLESGFSIAAFEFLICAWFFGSQGMFYLLMENIEFCSKVEYYGLYLAPVPLTRFIYQVMGSKLMKRLVLIIGIVYTGFYYTATFLELFGIKNYSEMLPLLHFLAGITIVCLVIAVFMGTTREKNSYVIILRAGVLLAMVCGLTEILRFNLLKYFLGIFWVTTHGLSALAILAIAVSLVVYLISYSTSEYTLRIEQRQLMKLAYRDALTGMPNRADCYRNIEKMEKDNIREYTMVFIDLNDLKLANDKWGHEMGDRLLRSTAKTISDVFSESGFISRWGGDEFVACVYGKKEIAQEKIGRFSERIAKINEKKEFPFRVSAASGCSHSTEADYIPPIQAIRLADSEMYINKRKMKQEG